MLVWIRGIQPRRTQVAEVGVTPRTDHVVAAMCLLRRSTARRTRARVQLQIFQRGLLFLCQFVLVPLRRTADEFPVPSLQTATTKGEPTIFTYTQEVGRVEFLVDLFAAFCRRRLVVNYRVLTLTLGVVDVIAG